MNENAKISALMKSAIIKNPLLFEAIGVAPVVAMAMSLKTAIMLAVISIIELIIIELITCKFLKLLKSRFRVLIYAVLGVLINIPMFLLFDYFAPNETAKVSIFLPLIAVNSLVALHCERFAVRHNIKETLSDALFSGFGYAIIVLLVGLVREIIGSGTVYGVDLHLPVKLSGMLLPFGGFIVLGYISAVFKRVIKASYPDENPEAAFNLSEISQSHFDNLKNLFEEDFNPFNEENDSEAKQKKLFDLKPKKEKSKKKKVKENKKQTETSFEIIDETKKVSEAEIVDEAKEEIAENIISDSKKIEYESEFDDLLAELEIHKKHKTAQEKDGDDE